MTPALTGSRSGHLSTTRSTSPPEARLDSCRRDRRIPALQEVASLLGAHPAAEGFLSTPAAAGAAAAAAAQLRRATARAFEVLGLRGRGWHG